jgi:hypothetical protein
VFELQSLIHFVCYSYDLNIFASPLNAHISACHYSSSTFVTITCRRAGPTQRGRFFLCNFSSAAAREIVDFIIVYNGFVYICVQKYKKFRK